MIYGYLAGAVLFLVALAGAGYKGFQLGGDRVRVEWSQANQAAQAQIAADKQAQELKARKLASRYEAKIATQALTTREVKSALEKALAANPLPADCRIDDGVRELWNRANRGEGEAAGKLPSPSKPPP